MKMPELPPPPSDRYAVTGDIKDVNWILLSDVQAYAIKYGEAVREACAKVAEDGGVITGPNLGEFEADIAAAIRKDTP